MFYYDGNIFYIAHFSKINLVSNEIINISLDNKNIVISGCNLIIIQLADDEMYLQGEIKKVEMLDE